MLELEFVHHHTGLEQFARPVRVSLSAAIAGTVMR
jgi:hypothetical protein